MYRKNINLNTGVLCLLGGLSIFLVVLTVANFYIVEDIKKPLPAIPTFMLKSAHPGAAAKSIHPEKEQADLSATGNGTLNGNRRQYYQNGRLFTETLYKEGRREGLAKSYFKTGIVKQEIEWRQGKPGGMQREYYPDRRIKYEAFFEDGLRQGMETAYYQDGRVLMEQEYENGRRLYTRRYDLNGNLMFERKYDEPSPEPEQ